MARSRWEIRNSQIVGDARALHGGDRASIDEIDLMDEARDVVEEAPYHEEPVAGYMRIYAELRVIVPRF
ncbi:MAG: hypothetical protein WBQ89_14920 [Candidatus Acidiferrum sp.]